MSLWIKDPVTKKPSVSLTLLLTATFLMIGAIVLDYFRIIKSSDLLSEFFMTSVGLYFGRRIKWGPMGSEVEGSDEKREA